MGPQHDSCGRALVVALARVHLLLQWGRNMIVAEGSRPVTFPIRLAALQWGRNMIVAEGCTGSTNCTLGGFLQWGRNMIVAEGARPHCFRCKLLSFNGAAT